MKQRYHRRGPPPTLLFGLLLASALLLAGGASAQDDQFRIAWSTVSNGGGFSGPTNGAVPTPNSDGDFRLGGTIGQPVVGSASGGDLATRSGFWVARKPAANPPVDPAGFKVYAPIVLK